MDLNVLISKAEKKLVNVHPEVAKKAIELVKKCHAKGINILITQGVRTIAEQNKLYNQGRFGNPGNIVTNARGGYSIHNFGLAFDFAVYGKDGKTIEWSTSIDTNSDGYKDYLQVGAIGKSLNLKWGGDFRSIVDYPHFEYTFGLSLAALRAGKRPPGSATIEARSYLQRGDSGAAVKELQTLLIAAGQKLEADGEFGQATQTALMAYQKANGLVVDGLAGTGTMAKLKAKTAASTNAAVAPAEPKQEEEIKLFQSSNVAIKNATRNVLTRLVEKDPKGIDPSWVEKLDKGTLTESDATGLLFVAIDRGLIQEKKE